MNQETKIECYRKAYQTLKQMEGVRNLGYPDEKKDLEFYCDIGRFHVNYNLRMNRDFITIRAGKSYKGKTDEELDQIGRELSNGQSFYYTGYDEKLYLQLSLPMAGISDEAARTRIDQETVRFFHFLMDVEGVSMEEVPETEEPEEEPPMEEGRTKGVFPEPGQEDDGIPMEEPAPGVMEPESRMAELEWIAARRKENEKQEAALKEKESGLETREGELCTRAEQLDGKEQELSARETDLKGRLEAVEARESEIRAQREALSKREETLRASEAALAEQERHLTEREASLKEQEADEGSRMEQVKEQEAALKSQKTQLEEKEGTLIEREKLVVTKTAILQEKEAMLEEKAENLNRREQEAKDTLAQLAQEDEALSRRIQEAEKKEQQAEEQIRETGTATELKKQLEAKEAAWKKELAETKESSEKDRAALTEEKENLTKERNRLTGEAARLKEKQEETRKALADCRKELEDTRKELKGCREELERIRAGLQEAERNQQETERAKEQEALDHAARMSECQNSLEAEKGETRRLQGELAKSKEEMRKAEGEKADLLQELETRKETERRLRSSLTRKAAEQEEDRDQIAALKDQLAEYKRQMEHIGTPEEVLKDFAETRKENRMLKREIQDREVEAAANEQALLDRIQSLLDQQETAKEDAQKEEEAKLPKNLAERMAGELKTSGITVTPEEASGHWYLRGTKESCTIVIDVEQRIVQVAKELRKPFKYNEDVSNWNREDFAESYILDKSGITCRRQVRDVTMDVNKVLRKLIILK